MAKNHVDSNYKLAKDVFLSKVNVSTSTLFCSVFVVVSLSTGCDSL